MSSQTVARRYASALADVIIANNEVAQVREELAGWERMMLSNPVLMEVISNPTVGYEQKSRILSELISRTRVSKTTANFFRVLLRNQRLAELPGVNEKLDQILDERAGAVSAQITSARTLPESVKTSLAETLGRVTQKKVRLEFKTDELLLGGIVTRIGSTIYDGSVRNQLAQLGEELAG
ncbi:MAG TPA: ATP synthase F1 subunit delta [Pyrinomonadaceae bacterium]|nr:ATP synthase F1 subunit delta [Pyrinomonadaceae bacterium]